MCYFSAEMDFFTVKPLVFARPYAQAAQVSTRHAGEFSE